MKVVSYEPSERKIQSLADDLKSRRSNSHAVFVGIPLVGHLTPLLRQGQELASRGWTVTFATLAGGEKIVAPFVSEFLEGQNGKDTLNIVVIADGDCDQDLYDKVFPSVARAPYKEGPLSIFSEYVIPMWECVYKSLMNKIKERVQRVNAPTNVVIGDAYTLAAYDIATALGTSFVVNSADPTYALSDRVIPNDFRLPPMLSGRHRRDLGTAFAERMVGPLLQKFIRFWLCSYVEPKLNAARKAHSIEKELRLDSYLLRTMILVTLPYSYEYPRLMGPLVNLVGAMLPLQYPALWDEETSWIEKLPLPAVFVNMGTIAMLTDESLSEILSALVSGAESSSFRSLWRLTVKQQEELACYLSVSSLSEWLSQRNLLDHIHVSSWVSSQQSVLQHESVRGFVSHCGCNSVMEAATFGVPVVCIPSFADQVDMASRGEDQGVAVFIHKHELQSRTLYDAISKTLYPIDPQSQLVALSRVRHLQEIAGGVTRAADLIEHAAWFGVDHLATADSFEPEWRALDFDVAFAWFVVAALTVVSIYKYFTRRAQKQRHDVEKNKTV